MMEIICVQDCATDDRTLEPKVVWFQQFRSKP